MLEVPVYNTEGKQVDTMSVSDDAFGTRVNTALLKQAVVGYHANKRQGTVGTKSRGMVKGSTKKLFRQKGTGNARRGSSRTNVLRGGGVAFAKQRRDFRKKMPQKMRIAAWKTAILAKILGNDLAVVDGLACEAPKTSQMAKLLENLSINRSCLLALHERDANIYLSSRNLQDLTVRIAEELNAFDIATRQKMLITRQAMEMLMEQEA
ncbi:MAG: 50S ribosomal protein L4 [Phycisphaerae bacterium]|jgi:large subunit ribosomal protein L4|nr:50S ribosomal protein L4 [Phycisphaerae bacterium]MDP7289702.1 50S ribosomal protein L4 [Phycisphaerae bacterium]